MKRNPLLFFDRVLSGKSWQQLGLVLLLFITVLLCVASVYTLFGRHGRFDKNIHQAFVDMTNTETVRDSVYGFLQPNINELGQFETTKPESRNKPGFWKVFGLAFVFVLGAVFFTGLLIATITNIWRARAEKYRRGTVKYRFSGHIVFLGYNNLIAGMIQKICEKEDVVVVGVEENASAVSDKIKNRLFDKYRKKVVVLKADSCNRGDLERLRIPYAKEVYIIGEHDDAYNLKCYRTIYELSLCNRSSETKMPQCYVNLQSQATLTLFRTYASAGELGIDFTEFHSFSFYDEWARLMIQKKWQGSENLQYHFIVAGMTEMGVALARKAALLCHHPNNDKPTIITFIDEKAHSRSKNFIIQHQDFFEHDDQIKDVKFEFVEGDLSIETIRQDISKKACNSQLTTTIAICYNDSRHNITMGINLPNNVYEEKSNVHIWVYQPTSGDLGKYLKGSRYKNVITFGMSGNKLDIRNEENIFKAKLINHYFYRENDSNIDYSNLFLIDKEWEAISISDRWSYIRRAEFIPFLLQYKDDMSKMVKLEHNRRVADDALFGKKGSLSQQQDQEKYINAIQYDIAPHKLN